MGFLDKVKKSMSAPDHGAVIQRKLGDEQILATVPAISSASAPNRREKTFKDLGDVVGDAVHRTIDGAVERRYIGGADGTIARGLPNDQQPLVVALGNGSLSIWKFGMGERKENPDLIARIPRAQVTSIVDTGKREARGHVRFSFADGSFFTYQTLAAPSEEFWAAATEYDQGR